MLPELKIYQEIISNLVMYIFRLHLLFSVLINIFAFLWPEPKEKKIKRRNTIIIIKIKKQTKQRSKECIFQNWANYHGNVFFNIRIVTIIFVNNLLQVRRKCFVLLYTNGLILIILITTHLRNEKISNFISPHFPQ